jgi:excisionase family DNA binding protein
MTKEKIVLEMNKFLTPADVARFAGVTARTIQRWTDSGKLPEWRDEQGRRIYDLFSLLKAKELAKRK